MGFGQKAGTLKQAILSVVMMRYSVDPLLRGRNKMQYEHSSTVTQIVGT